MKNYITNKRKRILKVAIVTILLIVNLLSLAKGEMLEKKPIFRVHNEEKKISLTFDINWAEKEYLFNILEVLDKYNVKGTFFIMGGWVNYTEENKEKLIKIKERGHEIGNHSYIHPSFTKISEERIRNELDKTDNIIFETIGERPKLFRFPSGDYNEKTLDLITNLGYTCIQWDVDSVDWKQLGEEIEYERVMKKAKSGSIILFHNNAVNTPKNLDKIISKLINNGFEFIPVGQLIYNDNYYIDGDGEQHKNNY